MKVFMKILGIIMLPFLAIPVVIRYERRCKALNAQLIRSNGETQKLYNQLNRSLDEYRNVRLMYEDMMTKMMKKEVA